MTSDPTDRAHGSDATDPIAVIGMACRLPGAEDPARFWQLLRDGVDAVSQTPDDRWPMEELYDADVSAPGKVNSRHGGYLDRDTVLGFDAAFFGISPREARQMDPQQRIMLELSWEAFEDARIDPLTGLGPADPGDAASVGVFVGSIWSDFATLLNRGGVDRIGRHALTGTHRGIIANRISFFHGLRGPSLVVDTGQSSSLVAVHLACESLRRGESVLALAGGVNLALAGESHITAGKLAGFSPDGHCYTFDARANGYVRAEGAGLVVLKPLRAALDDGDRIHAVIRGSAVNNDGGGTGLTTPSSQAQEAVIRAACRAAGVPPHQVQYVELHGTGTKVGDPVEAEALGNALGKPREADSPPLAVGSVKTNIGHLEAAAGIAGLMKTVLSLKHRELPASLHFDTPNPHIPLGELNLRVQREAGPWPDESRPLIAGVSSFGMGGTNAHVILEQAPEPYSADVAGSTGSGDADQDAFCVWVLSGRSVGALRAQGGRLAGALDQAAGVDVNGVGRVLAGRARLEHRAVLCGSGMELAAGLQALADGREHEGLTVGFAGAARPRCVFVYPGQGSQWPGMAAALYGSSQAFAARLQECARALQPFVDWPVLEMLTSGSGEWSRTDVVQPALFAVMLGITAAWQDLGVVPDAVVGHSQGEIAAAVAAGVLSLEDGARLCALRARALSGLSGTGAMASVPLPAADLTSDLPTRLEIAAVNGPRHTVIAGPAAVVADFVAECQARDVRARLIDVDYASHSVHIESLHSVLAELKISPSQGRIPFYSTVTAARISDTTVLDAAYWWRNLRQPVRFHDTVQALHADGFGMFIESSPHPVLVPALEHSFEDFDTVVIGSLRRDHDGLRQLLGNAARAHVHGAPFIPPGTSSPQSPDLLPDLPTYPFQHKLFPLPFGPMAESGESRSNDLDLDLDSVPLETDEVNALAVLLGGLTPVEQDAHLLAMVRRHAAAVLGHDSLASITNEQTFKSLGLDSLGAVDLSARLANATGVPVPSTVLFNYPTPTELVVHLRARILGSGTDSVLRSATGIDLAEPLAVVGMACRFPGGVGSPEDLWDLVLGERDAVGTFPTDRGWDVQGLYDPDPDRVGFSYTRSGGFLFDAGGFDAEFFGISPREALAMDPQQRLLLETAWEAVERSGLDPTALRGTRTGVFTGAMTQEYGPGLSASSDNLGGYLLTGGSISVASGRVSYVLGLEGPAVSVDTACSSSLVALHLAGQALRAGECDLALAGGVTVMAGPGLFVDFSRQRGLSRDGRCKAFAAAADGTGFSEGVGLLVLERLSDAARAGRRVWAVVRGSAVNQDGASNGLTAPNGPSQERVIAQALANAGLVAADVDLIEGHGTGTVLGDPIEAQAVAATYGRNRAVADPVYLGSLKSNIGHAQAAAGVGGVIKAVMAMRAGVLPKTLHVDAPSPHVDWAGSGVSLLTETRPWPETGRPRRAAVSSFGISGTNAHVILEQAPEPASADVAGEDALAVWVVSGRSAGALRAQGGRLAEVLDQPSGLDVAGVGRALAGRARLEHRAVLCGSRSELTTGLQALAEGHEHEGLTIGFAGSDRPRCVFVYPGQGSQWPGMAAALYGSNSAFAARLQECAEALQPFVDWPVLEMLTSGSGEWSRTDVVQPALFAVMLGITAAWHDLGVVPDAVVGHSQGEIAAAVTAGVLSLEDGARLCALRARALSGLSGTGAMASVPLPAADLPAGLEIAAINGPRHTVIAGPAAVVADVVAEYQARDVRARLIDVDYASHSVHIESLHSVLAELKISPSQGRIPFYSTVTAARVTDTTVLDAAYWWQNLRRPVRFHDTVLALHADGFGMFIESSPHPVLVPALEHSFEDFETVVIGSLRRDHDGLRQLLGNAARAHVHGAPLIPPGTSTNPVPESLPDLPTYAFQHSRYWLAPAAGGSAEALGQDPGRHPLLDAMVAHPDGSITGTAVLTADRSAWIRDHALYDTVVLPGAALLELVLNIAAGTEHPHLQELTLYAPLILPEDHRFQLNITYRPDTDTATATVHTRPADSDEPTAWTHHATAVLTAEPSGTAAVSPPKQGARATAPATFYADLYDRGYHYGPVFQGLTDIRHHGHQAWATATLPAVAAVDGFLLHPALLDAALHTVFLTTDTDQLNAAPQLPFTFTDTTIHRRLAAPTTVGIYTTTEGATHTITITGSDNAPILTTHLTTRTLNPQDFAAPIDQSVFELNWIQI
ncbi:type I polyketide synthase, partial [Catenulispora rubra]|uniref:type I polyketide synthase n=1 Tax=Catenulispora rubra TaxID=280293 RepID=UPI003F699B4F